MSVPKPSTNARSLVVLAVLLYAQLAAAYPGEQLLNWSRNNIIGPLGLMAVVVAIASSLFEPKFIKGAVYVAIICCVLFFVIGAGPQMMEAMR